MIAATRVWWEKGVQGAFFCHDLFVDSAQPLGWLDFLLSAGLLLHGSVFFHVIL